MYIKKFTIFDTKVAFFIPKQVLKFLENNCGICNCTLNKIREHVMRIRAHNKPISGIGVCSSDMRQISLPLPTQSTNLLI